MPRKIAIFTEGQTEQIFVNRLLTELAGEKQIRVDLFRVFGGRKYATILYRLTPLTGNSNDQYFAMIVDCGSDASVTSQIRDRYESLVSAGYTAILAIRDVRPSFTRADVPRLVAAFNQVLRQQPVAPLLILPTMETEAWFIGEHTHFERIHNSLTVDFIRDRYGLDVVIDDIESRHHPAADLDAIYGLAMLGYSKSKADVERTVNALDYQIVKQALPQRVPSLHPLVRAIDSFLQ